MEEIRIPKEINKISKALIENGFLSYLVGGCVRDVFLGKAPKDWDVATDAEPNKIQEIFSESVYENEFGTVGVKTDSEDASLKIIEVTTFRIEGKYSDRRHPDEIKFSKTIEEDLKRRDFTINAMAIDLKPLIQNLDTKNNPKFLIDPYFGAKDLDEKIIRTVLNPDERFNEDALRLLRAIRFSAELGFEIDENTKKSIIKNAKLISDVSEERIRDEFIKIIMSEGAKEGINLMLEFGILKYVLPELEEGASISQNKHHTFDVFDHSVRSLDYSAKKNHSLEVRLASLFHDVGKPRTKRGEGESATFYHHEHVGAKMTKEALLRLKFPKETIEHVSHLVRQHLFYYNVGEVTEAGVRRLLKRVGVEYIDDLISVREADRIGSGVPKAFPYKLRHLLFMIEKVRHDPLHPKMLVLKGDSIMKILSISPSPKVGFILSILLEEVIDDPSRNNEEYLRERILELGNLSDTELQNLSDVAKEKRDEAESDVEEEMKEKYFVK